MMMGMGTMTYEAEKNGEIPELVKTNGIGITARMAEDQNRWISENAGNEKETSSLW